MDASVITPTARLRAAALDSGLETAVSHARSFSYNFV